MNKYAKELTYLVIGGLTFSIYYFFLWIHFGLFGLSSYLAVAISYLFCLVFHFYANKRITFNDQNNANFNQIYRYLIVASINYFLQICIIKLLFETYKINFYISAFFGVLATLFIGFFLLKSWVFKRRFI